MTTLMSKNRLPIIAITTGALLFFASCDLWETKVCKSYVTTYVRLNSFSLEPAAGSSRIDAIIGNRSEALSFDCHFLSKGDNLRRYEEYCRKRGDVSYEQRVLVHKGGSIFTGPTYLTEDFVSVAVISDTDYDESHPAGTNLSDICRFMAFSPYPFIASGYRNRFDYGTSSISEEFCEFAQANYGSLPDEEFACHPIDKPLSDVTLEDLKLLGLDYPKCLFGLLLEKRPSSSGEHTISVKIVSESGKSYSASTIVTF